MTLVYGICRDGAGILLADTATTIPMTGQLNHPFREPTLKILTIGETILGYSGNTSFLSRLLTDPSKVFSEFTGQLLECHQTSQQEIEFIALRRDGQEMKIISNGSIGSRERCYIGSQQAFRAFRQTIPTTTPPNVKDEFSSARIGFGDILRSPIDGVAGLPISCTAGSGALGYVTHLSNTAGPIDLDNCELHEDGWRTLPLIDRLGGQFTVILTGMAYAGICIGYPQPGIGFLFAADDPEPIVKMAVPNVSHRDLGAYDLAGMADALDAGGIQVGIPDSYDVARTLAAFLRELNAERAEPHSPAPSPTQQL